MKAHEYISLCERSRIELYSLWKAEPEFANLFTKNIVGKTVAIPCFVHPDDKNKTTLKSLKHTHREL